MDERVAAVKAGSFGAASSSMVIPALMAAFLGLFLVWGVGFASPMAMHNAAHDARHSAGFPCH